MKTICLVALLFAATFRSSEGSNGGGAFSVGIEDRVRYADLILYGPSRQQSSKNNPDGTVTVTAAVHPDQVFKGTVGTGDVVVVQPEYVANFDELGEGSHPIFDRFKPLGRLDEDRLIAALEFSFRIEGGRKTIFFLKKEDSDYTLFYVIRDPRGGFNMRGADPKAIGDLVRIVLSLTEHPSENVQKDFLEITVKDASSEQVQFGIRWLLKSKLDKKEKVRLLSLVANQPDRGPADRTYAKEAVTFLGYQK
jgi:hypothetical protein